MFKYWKEKRKAQKETVKLINTILPVVNNIAENQGQLVSSIVNIIKAFDGVSKETIQEQFISSLAEVIHNDNNKEG